LPNIYYDKDADVSILKNKVIAIIGYGNQGRSQALNMRDNGLNVIVGSIKDESWEKAKEDKFRVYPIEKAAELADVVCMLIPDEVQPSVYNESIKNQLKKGDVLNFSSGYNIHYGFIKPPPLVDVIMVAPKMIGVAVRELFVKGSGVPAMVAVHQNRSGKAKEIALAIAKSLGATRVGAIESSFEEETVLDLFGEQMMAGGSLFMTKMAFEVLTEAGYDPLTVLFDLYLSGESIQEGKLRARHGLFKQLKFHSTTSQYGQLTRGASIASKEVKKKLMGVLREIRSGKFAREWGRETRKMYPTFKKLREEILKHPINVFEEEVKKKIKVNYD
jgi:ketol-acid reductoisomerase